MATDGPSRVRVAVILLIVASFLLPVVTSWLDLVDVPAVGTQTLVRLAGLAVLVVVLGLLVLQKRRTRGQRASRDAPEESEDRRVEGSSDAYDNRMGYDNNAGYDNRTRSNHR